MNTVGEAMGTQHEGNQEAAYKTCACGARYTREAWGQLEYVGLQHDAGEHGEPCEMRNCTCGSTIGVELPSAETPEANFIALGRAFGAAAAEYSAAHARWRSECPEECAARYSRGSESPAQDGFTRIVAGPLAAHQAAREAMADAARRLYDGADNTFAAPRAAPLDIAGFEALVRRAS